MSTTAPMSPHITEATVRGSYGGKPVDWTLPEFCDLVAFLLTKGPPQN